MAAICSGSLAEIFWDRLLSMPQQRHAPRIEKEPNVAQLSPPGKERITPPARIAPIPIAIRRSKFSRNTNHAMDAVKTASMFRSNDAIDPEVLCNPKSRRTGPRIPPKKRAPANHGRSFLVNRASSVVHARRKAQVKLSPAPDPRYRRAASRKGDTSPRRTFENGVLRPNSNAAPRAAKTPLFVNRGIR